jgi:hypothetical protein
MEGISGHFALYLHSLSTIVTAVTFMDFAPGVSLLQVLEAATTLSNLIIKGGWIKPQTEHMSCG